ncbi:MAG: diadenylate cyclase CdaA [Porphyromonadaceae bacterium]|nr:diadenylate cyclase CdaA [Porphyromonadaceae bacterium]
MFAHFGIKDMLDILIVAALLYSLYCLMRESGSINIFIDVLVFIGVWVVVTRVLDMKLIGAIMDKLISVGVIILVILFHDELRQFLVELGSRKRWRFFFRFFRTGKRGGEARDYITPVVYACISLSKGKVGALIVIKREMPLASYEYTGDIINADVNSRLIENIFFKNSPMHDGAMIISDNRIRAAGCILPVSHSLDIPKSLGLRHRAALGISQETDAIAVVVSEETGNISVAMNGKFKLRLSTKELEQILATA